MLEWWPIGEASSSRRHAVATAAVAPLDLSQAAPPARALTAADLDGVVEDLAT